MKCEICGEKEAVLFVQQVTATRTIEMHICLDCAKEKGISTSFSVKNKFAGNFLDKEQNANNSAENVSCPICGLTLADLRRQNLSGCPECYTVFKSEIFSILKSYKIEGTYHGSLPKKLPNFRSTLTDRMFFQTKLAEAVAIEDYEKAAVYRDRLKALDARFSVVDSSCEDDYE